MSTWSTARQLQLLASCALLGAGCYSSPLPSDRAFEDKFAQQRPRLDTLLAMADADSKKLRASGHGDELVITDEEAAQGAYDSGVPASRVAEYHAIMRRLGTRFGLHGDSTLFSITVANEQYAMRNAAWGVASRGKGFAWSRMTPTPLLQSLEVPSDSACGDYRRVYKRITGSWYLFLYCD
jgi:hypothetical protein